MVSLLVGRVRFEVSRHTLRAGEAAEYLVEQSGLAPLRQVRVQLVCAESAAYAFDDLYYLERACMVQVLAQSTGRPLRHVSAEVAALTARQFVGERQQSDLHFEALKRSLTAGEPGWMADIQSI